MRGMRRPFPSAPASTTVHGRTNVAAPLRAHMYTSRPRALETINSDVPTTSKGDVMQC